MCSSDLAVLTGIVFLAIRRGIVRPIALGPKVSLESILIAGFIATLMITFLLTWRLDEASAAGRVNWWVHSVVILAFLALIPASKHFHLVLSPITVFLKSPELGNVPNLDFEKEQVGLETLKDLGSKTVLDAFDERVRDYAWRFVNGASVAHARVEVRDVLSAVVDALRDQTMLHAPLTIFVVAGAVLFLFMVRT